MSQNFWKSYDVFNLTLVIHIFGIIPKIICHKYLIRPSGVTCHTREYYWKMDVTTVITISCLTFEMRFFLAV